MVRVVCIAILLCLALSPAAKAGDFPVGDRNTMWADPYLIGSLRKVGEIFASRPVARGRDVFQLPRGAQIADMNYVVHGQTHSLESYFERSRTTGIIVLKSGRIVFERYRLGADERSLLMSMSVAKSFVSTLLGVAIGEGLIASVDDPISDYLPELKGSGYDGVPIKAVLQMSSGVDFVEGYSDPNSDFNRMWRQSIADNERSIADFVSMTKRLRPPFERFYYSSIETVALALLLSRVTQKPLADYLSEKLWVPLGMEAEANWVTDGAASGAREAAFCCLSATLRDYARFGLLMAEDGVWQGSRLLPPGWVHEATRPDRPQVQPGRLETGSTLGYQYHWWSLRGDDGAFMARGVNGQFLYVNPAQELVIVVTNVWPVWWSPTLELHSFAVFESFVQVLRQ